ncbi:serine/threonine protein kinase [Nocardioides oleivorans]|uniref:non-specific serine/threonine protein kinase n=1 Tax=Nocardioides oleivorans TaxID=273676 RepID=A0A4Q2RQL3_9ACTN|nr:serine/threonine-protein kinase [Nocardioides oleivorans]RYB89999.1 serine/threonine protein kinase [Nocardioides oleivorans]
MGTRDDGWKLAEGEDLAPGLSALRRLGGGSAYEAWLCFDEVTWSAVVVKVLRPSQVDDESSRRGLRREVLALRTVNHPVVVRSLRDGQDGERPHVVLEHVDGPRLSSLVRRHGRLQEQQYLPLAIDVASALHYLRHLGWTHLDIKPSNVIMGAPARLIDLSVARLEEDARRLRHPIGTDAYMAPEQADPTGEHAPSYAADVWGLGATLFHAVAGRRPFAHGDPDADDVRLRFPQLVQAPGPLPDGVPGPVADVLDACLQRDPDRRPLPHEVADALEPVLAGLPRGSLAAFRVR